MMRQGDHSESALRLAVKRTYCR